MGDAGRARFNWVTFRRIYNCTPSLTAFPYGILTIRTAAGVAASGGSLPGSWRETVTADEGSEMATVQTYVDEIARHLARSVAANQLALSGLRRIVEEVGCITPTAGNPDPMMYVGEGDPNVRMEPHGWIRRSELIEQAGHGGAFEAVLTQQWVVATFAKWEGLWRPELAERLQVGAEDIVSDLFGDLRLLRNEIVHHGAVACGEHAGRCRVLHFEEGDIVRLDRDHFRTVITAVDVRLELQC